MKAGPLKIIKAPHLTRVEHVTKDDNGDTQERKLAPSSTPAHLDYKPREPHQRPPSHEATGRYNIKTGEYETSHSLAILGAAVEAIACRIATEYELIAQKIILCGHTQSADNARAVAQYLYHAGETNTTKVSGYLLEFVADYNETTRRFTHRYNGTVWTRDLPGPGYDWRKV